MNLKKIFKYVPQLLLILMFLTPITFVHAQIGSGVIEDKLTADKKLQLGEKYTFDTFTVINPAIEKTVYTFDFVDEQDSKNLSVKSEWFTFEPAEVTLEEGETAKIKLTVDLPYKTAMGDYSTNIVISGERSDDWKPADLYEELYNENGTVQSDLPLTFTVLPNNPFSWISYYFLLFWNNYQPWSMIGVALVGVSVVGAIAIRFVPKIKNDSKEI